MMFFPRAEYILPLIIIIGSSCPKSEAGNYTEWDCLSGFSSLDFHFQAFDRYDEFYTNESRYHLPQMGDYYGPDDIMEYVSTFAGEDSPYVTNTTLVNSKFVLRDFDPQTGTCPFLHLNTKQLTMNPENANPGSFLEADMTKVVYEIPQNKVSLLSVFFTDDLIHHAFGHLLDSDKTREYICGVMIDTCPEVHEFNGSPTMEECVDRMRKLPMTTNGAYIDGNSQGCRVWHANLATSDQLHCAHISFEPLEDDNGKIKCQDSKLTNPGNYFTEEEIQLFDEYLLSSEGLVESPTGIKILDGSGDGTGIYDEDYDEGQSAASRSLLRVAGLVHFSAMILGLTLLF